MKYLSEVLNRVGLGNITKAAAFSAAAPGNGSKMNTPQKRICWNEMIVPGIALLFVIAYFVQTRDAPAVAVYWPVITAVGGGILWSVILLKYVALKRKTASSDSTSSESFFKGFERPALLLAGSIIYLVVVPRIGFSISNFIFMLALFRGLGSRQWTKNIMVAVGVALFLHLALIVFMKLGLPQLNLGYFSI